LNFNRGAGLSGFAFLNGRLLLPGALFHECAVECGEDLLAADYSNCFPRFRGFQDRQVLYFVRDKPFRIVPPVVILPYA
jgi:hypothetical protein